MQLATDDTEDTDVPVRVATDDAEDTDVPVRVVPGAALAGV
jgi:hypothetical protein